MPSTTFKFRIFPSPLGAIAYVARAGRLVAIYLPGNESRQTQAILRDFPNCEQDNRLMNDFAEQLSRYFSVGLDRFSVPIELRVSEFTRSVLCETRKITFGKTITYGQLARRIGRPRAYRAVGRALGSNPLPLVIPCHRVIAADGTLGGFGGGLKLKHKMLKHEGAI